MDSLPSACWRVREWPSTRHMNVCLPPCRSQYQCTDVEVIDSEHHRTTGLAPGQYACWNPVEYRWCPRTEPAPPPPPSPTTPDERGDSIESSSSYTDGQVAGLAVGLLVLGLLLGLIIGRLSSKWSKTTTPKEVAPPQA